MNSKPDIAIVDLQGFKDMKNQFIIKEFAIFINGYTQTFLVKPPYSFNYLSKEEKKQVRWLENNRGVYWSEGYIDYREFKRTIIPYLNKSKIVAKGTEKIKWIHDLCQNCEIIDMGENGCPNFSKLYDIYAKSPVISNCINHNKKCALKNVMCIKKWCDDNDVNVF